MGQFEGTTVDRLDRPSAYYIGKVSRVSPQLEKKTPQLIKRTIQRQQNKKRRFNQDRDEPEDPYEPLRNATTLYVGNLYAVGLGICACDFIVR